MHPKIYQQNTYNLIIFNLLLISIIYNLFGSHKYIIFKQILQELHNKKLKYILLNYEGIGIEFRLITIFLNYNKNLFSFIIFKYDKFGCKV